MTEIKLTEKEKKVFEKIEEKHLDMYIVLNKNSIAKKRLLNIFFYKVINFVKENQGVLQSSLYEGFLNGSRLSAFFYLADKKGIVRRVKSGRSYALYVDKDITKEEFLKQWETIVEPKQDINITFDVYPKSKEIIEDYFGFENIKTLYKFAIQEPPEDIHPVKFSNEGIEIQMSPTEDSVDYYQGVFLSDIGGCIKFEMNYELRQIIDKYWIEECNIGLKEFLKKYGFFADRSFVRYKLGDIIGENNKENLFNELRNNSSQFKIKWCAFAYQYIKYYHIPYHYASSLKFKWGLKPELTVKKCKYCGKEFIPSIEGKYYDMEKILKYYPIETSINEVNFCRKHFPPTYEMKFQRKR